MSSNNELTEGIHCYYAENKLMVFTEKYHLERGYCCGNGCRHCPYHHENVAEQAREILLAEKKYEKKKS